MDRFIAVVVDDESTAYKATDALKELHRKGDLVIYAHGVITKDANGVAALKKSEDEGSVGTAFGLLMGAMVGVLSGPSAVATREAVADSAAATTAAGTGMALGSMSGGLMGMYRDLWVSGTGVGVVDMVATELTPGKSCLVASIDEVMTTPLDVRMKELGGTLYRKPRIDVEDDKIETRMDQLDAEHEAPIDALEVQITTAAGTAKSKSQKRKSELTADCHERKAKLQKASSLAAEELL